MRQIFADAFFWIALVNPRDNWHARAKETLLEIRDCQLVTTDEVLAEVMTFYAESGQFLRCQAISLMKRVKVDPTIKVLPQTA